MSWLSCRLVHGLDGFLVGIGCVLLPVLAECVASGLLRQVVRGRCFVVWLEMLPLSVWLGRSSSSLCFWDSRSVG